MPNLIDVVIEYLLPAQGKTVELKDIRSHLHIEVGSKDDTNLRKLMSETLVARRIVSKPGSGRDGVYKVVKQVSQVKVFNMNRQRRPPVKLYFPRDFTTDMEFSFAEFIVLREGDLITVGGVKSTGKTHFCLSICAENIDSLPVLMGNEYTVTVSDAYEPSPRFLDRVDKMAEWCQWTDEKGDDKFTLLPVSEDFAEHVIADRTNIADWINLDGDRLYDIGRVLKGFKSNVGRGVGVAALQKGEGTINPRGGQFVRDFSDLEILLDPFGKNPHDVLLTIKGAKETTKPIVGKTYAYTIGESGTKAFNFREVKRCPGCMGTGHYKGSDCEECLGTGFRDK